VLSFLSAKGPDVSKGLGRKFRIQKLKTHMKECMLFHSAITQCDFLMFSLGDRTVLLNDTEHQVDFKSHQWFGATVRSHGDTILVR